MPIPALLECVVVALQTLLGCCNRGEVAEKGDSPMSVRKEMFDRFDGASDVVRGNAICVEMPGGSVDEHERGACALLVIEIRVVVTRRNDDDPVDAPVAKRADQLPLAAWIFVAAAGKDKHVPRTSRILDRTMERGGKRVGHVLQDESDRLRLAPEPTQHRRIRVPSIIELLDCPPDLCLECRADSRLAVDDARDGLQGDASERRDVEHGGTPPGRERFP